MIRVAHNLLGGKLEVGERRKGRRRSGAHGRQHDAVFLDARIGRDPDAILERTRRGFGPVVRGNGRRVKTAIRDRRSGGRRPRSVRSSGRRRDADKRARPSPARRRRRERGRGPRPLRGPESEQTAALRATARPVNTIPAHQIAARGTAVGLGEARVLFRCQHYLLQSALLASAAPSRIDSNLAQQIVGCATRGPMPQSVPAMTFSLPTRFA